MNQTSSKAERTRKFIVERTAPIFNMKGYSGTSLTDLTAATGLTKGSIYGNFENKDDVAIARPHPALERVAGRTPPGPISELATSSASPRPKSGA